MGLLVAALVACAGVDGSPFAVTPRELHKNAPQLNSAALNGISLNGISLNGISLNGISLNGISLNGVPLHGLSLVGTKFVGFQVIEGSEVSRTAEELVGAEIRLIDAEDRVFVMHFDDIYRDPQDPDGDVYFYDITVHDLSTDVYTPLCTLNGQAVHTIPLTNRWDGESGDRVDDPEVVTFACEGAVLAKCVTWGYRPWAAATRCAGESCIAVSLAEYHQACTRMARADYCGEGTPHTVNGTLIDVFDPLSPQVQARSTADKPAWNVEAEWGPDGALCVGSALRLQILADNEIPFEVPSCLVDLEDLPACGSFPAERSSLLGSSYCEAWGTDPAACA